MDLLGDRIKALDYWRENNQTSQKCNSCENHIPWGDGFIQDESIFLCNPCTGKRHGELTLKNF